MASLQQVGLSREGLLVFALDNAWSDVKTIDMIVSAEYRTFSDVRE